MLPVYPRKWRRNDRNDKSSPPRGLAVEYTKSKHVRIAPILAVGMPPMIRDLFASLFWEMADVDRVAIEQVIGTTIKPMLRKHKSIGASSVVLASVAALCCEEVKRQRDPELDFLTVGARSDHSSENRTNLPQPRKSLEIAL